MANASLTANVTPLDAGAPVAAAGFLGPIPALALEDGTVLLTAPGAGQRIAAHPDSAILVAVVAAGKFLTGGDDGRVVAVSLDGTVEDIANEKGKWIDALTARSDGAIAWSSGKSVRARDASGGVKEFTAPSTVRGLAFMPKGYRIAIAHYDGASLWFSEYRRAARSIPMERLASFDQRFPGRAVSRDHDAGKHAARLARGRQAGHAHERLSRQNALLVLVLRWTLAGDIRRGCCDCLAVQG